METVTEEADALLAYIAGRGLTPHEAVIVMGEAIKALIDDDNDTDAARELLRILEARWLRH